MTTLEPRPPSVYWTDPRPMTGDRWVSFRPDPRHPRTVSVREKDVPTWLEHHPKGVLL